MEGGEEGRTGGKKGRKEGRKEGKKEGRKEGRGGSFLHSAGRCGRDYARMSFRGVRTNTYQGIFYTKKFMHENLSPHSPGKSMDASEREGKV